MHHFLQVEHLVTQLQKNRMKTAQRRLILLRMGILFFCYPLLRLASFKLPRKPQYIEINGPLQKNGYLLTENFILFDRNHRSWALSRRCTHLGCKLHYIEDSNFLECPCHQSRFAIDNGQVLRGPAKTRLSSFPVQKNPDTNKYVVTI